MASCGRSKAAEAAQERSVKRAGRMLSHSAALSLNQSTSLIYDGHKPHSDAPPWGSDRAAPFALNTVAICWPSPATHERIDKALVFLAHPGNWLAGPPTPFSITHNLTVLAASSCGPCAWRAARTRPGYKAEVVGAVKITQRVLRAAAALVCSAFEAVDDRAGPQKSKLSGDKNLV